MVSELLGSSLGLKLDLRSDPADKAYPPLSPDSSKLGVEGSIPLSTLRGPSVEF